MTATDMLLNKAADAIPRSAWAEALGAVCEAWSLTPSSSLSTLALHLDSLASMSPLRLETEQWLAALQTASRAERGRFWKSIEGETLNDTHSRVIALRPFARDPRCLPSIEALVRRVPWTSDASQFLWEALFTLVTLSADPTAHANAPALIAGIKVRDRMRDWLARTYTRAVSEISPPPAQPSAIAVQRIEKLRAALPIPGESKRDEGSLLQAVFDDPSSDEARFAYADWLQERGDLRGEFISLQYSGSAEAIGRAKTILETKSDDWVEPIAAVLSGPRIFRRGFLAEAGVRFRHQNDVDAYGGLPHWATLERADWKVPNASSPASRPALHFIGPAFRHLRIAIGAWAPHVLAGDTSWALESLQAVVSDPTELAELCHSPNLQRLTQLIVQGAMPDHALHRIERVGTIKTLQVEAETIAKWVERLEPLGLEELRVKKGRMRFSRGPDGRLSIATLHVPKDLIGIEKELISQLPDQLFDEVRFVAEKQLPADLVQLAKRKQRRSPQARANRRLVDPIPHRGLAVASDGTVALAASDRIVHVNLANKTILAEHPCSRAHRVQLSRDERQVWVVASGSLQRISLDVGHITFDSGMISDTPFTRLSDDERFASGESSAGKTDVLELGTGKHLTIPAKGLAARWVNYDRSWWLRMTARGLELQRADGKKTPFENAETVIDFVVLESGAIIGRTPSSVLRWDTATGRVTARYAIPASLGFVDRSLNSLRIVTNISANEAAVLNAITLDVVATHTLGAPLKAAALSHNGDRLALSDGSNVTLYDFFTAPSA